MPSRDPGNLLVANAAETVLLFPEVAEPLPAFESGFHLYVEAFFKVHLPGRVVGVGFCADLRVPLNADRRSRQQPDYFHLPFLPCENASENPAIWSLIRKVFVFRPATWFISMPALRPSPNGLEDSMVNGLVSRCTHHMTMIERPSTDLWVEFCYQISCGSGAAFFDTLSDLAKKGLHILFRWGNEELRTFSFLILA
jgi:hypothetical protein